MALLAIGLVAPTPARADCKHPSERPAFGLDAVGGRPAGSPRATDQAPPPKPCSGPSCSNKSAPTPTSAPATAPRAELWAIAPASPTPDRADRAAWAREEACVRPVRLAAAIFHPPRLPR